MGSLTQTIVLEELELRGKAQCDSPVLVLLAPPGEYDLIFTKFIYLQYGCKVL